MSPPIVATHPGSISLHWLNQITTDLLDLFFFSLVMIITDSRQAQSHWLVVKESKFSSSHNNSSLTPKTIQGRWPRERERGKETKSKIWLPTFFFFFFSSSTSTMFSSTAAAATGSLELVQALLFLQTSKAAPSLGSSLPVRPTALIKPAQVDCCLLARLDLTSLPGKECRGPPNISASYSWAVLALA